MKSLKYLLVTVLSIVVISCDEEELLKEEPLDFFSPENSYTKPEHFETALTYLYYQVRSIYYTNEPSNWFDMHIGTDLAVHGTDPDNVMADYGAHLQPSSNPPEYWWTRQYELIKNANVILDRISDIEFPSDAEKNAIIAEAKFFRAFGYRTLGYLFGGVPLVLEEISSVKRDFVRASRDQVYQQITEDLVYAAQHLPSINEVNDGKISKEVANHYLADVYVAQEQWDNAIVAASAVIENSGASLMTERFGRRSDEPGDVFWDLFQRGNQNRSSGNNEALWVIQQEFNTIGGAGPLNVWGGGGFKIERYYGALLFRLIDPDGKYILPGPVSTYGGRSIGWVRGTDHFRNTIWEGDFDNDLRNSQYNMIRDIEVLNKESAYYGQMYIADSLITDNGRLFRTLYEFPTKITTPGDHPDELYLDKDQEILTSNAGHTYADQYMLRVAETYLLRAEAYLGINDLTNAAADINEVRNRANANPVNESEIDIDFILDERLRELNFEEKRRLTLARLGLVYERTIQYNPFVTMESYHNLYPIPFSEIERNTEAELEQNSGYTN